MIVRVPPQKTPKRRRRLTFGCSSTLALIVLVGFVSQLPTTSANFSDTTQSLSNSWNSDALASPTNLQATIGANVALSWTASSDAYATGTRIYRSSTPGGPYSLETEVAPASTTSATDLPPSGTHYYIVRAYFMSWESLSSNEVSVTFTAQDFDGVATATDNCPSHFNIAQLDSDGDGIGDKCDPSPTAAGGLALGGPGAADTSESIDIAIVDLNGDSALDVVFANMNGQANTIWINTGYQLFGIGQVLGSADTQDIAFGDLDGDGDVDLVTANSNTTNNIWFNNGSAGFNTSIQSIDAGATRQASLGDLDGDGDLDIIFANYQAPSTIWFNNGSGSFTESASNLGTWDTVGSDLSDVDSDGDLDVLLTGYPGPEIVFLNDGSGSFLDSGQRLGTGVTLRAEFADIDNDGDDDYIAANYGQANTVWKNDGAGVFTLHTSTPQTLNSTGIGTGDFDGDGDIDFAISNYNQADTFWKNDGTGNFTLELSLDSNPTGDIELADIDGDGKLDAVFAGLAGTNNSARFHS